ncbi:molybdopterin-dependent oxidoreductase [Streptomyces purpureus]|uniref:molybdopterin-dependent oxidoreductase n=1 Tax=Streptomyces purpureus TaxID=1951 RepID=UPI0003638E47|nr:molybdopterin-dependent oxidoreductase [Streptomyces purpureus]
MTTFSPTSRTSSPRGPRRPLAALCGLLAGGAALAVAELTAAGVRAEAGPLTAVGGAVIDATPPGIKDWAIRTFGESDKLVLQLGIVLILAALAVALGLLALRHRLLAAAGVLALAVVGAFAATSRPDMIGPQDALPSLAGGVAGAVALLLLIGRLNARRPDTPSGWDRRGFLVTSGAVVAAAAAAAVTGRTLLGTRGRDASASRAEVVLPTPASPAPPVPPGAALRIPGLGPFTTPNDDFYRVDTALVVPRVDAGTWRLRVHGLGVREDLTLTFAELLARPAVERDITLACVSNEVGGPYIGNARWLGARLADLLRTAGVVPPSKGGPADQLVARSVDGMTIGTPVEDVMDGRDALLAYGMNGEPLPFTHGFPARMVVPGLYGYVSACKWIEEIELTTFDAYDAYWVRHDWAPRAPVKTQSRIDTPRPSARRPAGQVTIAGVAWAQHQGIARVEVRIDDGPWQEARLAAEDTRDTWRQWYHPWNAPPGRHTLTVRATDRTGHTQPGAVTHPLPDGAEGWHTVTVTIEE